MSKLREEIERRLAESGIFNTDKPVDASAPDLDTPEKVAPTETKLLAPQSFDAKFADDFANLSPEWQNFLCAHEDQVIQTLASCAEQLKDYTEIEQIYRAHCARVHTQGKQKLNEWLNGVAEIDARLQQNPAETLRALGLCYGVNLQVVQPTNDQLTSEVVGRLCELERSYNSLKDFMHQQQNQRLADIMRIFGNQKDEHGELAHPYFEAVKDQVFELLEQGRVQDVNEAYEKALWLNPAVREELIKQKIGFQAAEAKRAKQAAFAPHGKTHAPEKKLSLREEIEKNIAAYAD